MRCELPVLRVVVSTSKASKNGLMHGRPAASAARSTRQSKQICRGAALPLEHLQHAHAQRHHKCTHSTSCRQQGIIRAQIAALEDKSAPAQRELASGHPAFRKCVLVISRNIVTHHDGLVPVQLADGVLLDAAQALHGRRQREAQHLLLQHALRQARHVFRRQRGLAIHWLLAQLHTLLNPVSPLPVGCFFCDILCL